jgi:hypothetical protein
MKPAFAIILSCQRWCSSPTLVKLNLIALVILAAACTPTEQKSSPVIDEAVTRKILDHHIEAFRTNNMEETMADYTEESVLITPDATFRGLAEIRKNFEAAFAAFPPDSTTMNVTSTIVSGDIGYMLWTAKTPKFELKYATDTFIIQDGKIVRQTYAGLAQ